MKYHAFEPIFETFFHKNHPEIMLFIGILGSEGFCYTWTLRTRSCSAKYIRTDFGIMVPEFFEKSIIYFKICWFLKKINENPMETVKTINFGTRCAASSAVYDGSEAVCEVWGRRGVAHCPVPDPRAARAHVDEVAINFTREFWWFFMIFIDFPLIFMILWDIFCSKTIDIWTENYGFLWNMGIFHKSQLRAPEDLGNFEI